MNQRWEREQTQSQRTTWWHEKANLLFDVYFSNTHITRCFGENNQTHEKQERHERSIHSTRITAARIDYRKNKASFVLSSVFSVLSRKREWITQWKEIYAVGSLTPSATIITWSISHDVNEKGVRRAEILNKNSVLKRQRVEKYEFNFSIIIHLMFFELTALLDGITSWLLSAVNFVIFCVTNPTISYIQHFSRLLNPFHTQQKSAKRETFQFTSDFERDIIWYMTYYERRQLLHRWNQGEKTWYQSKLMCHKWFFVVCSVWKGVKEWEGISRSIK
jgi:hypothetical protein